MLRYCFTFAMIFLLSTITYSQKNNTFTVSETDNYIKNLNKLIKNHFIKKEKIKDIKRSLKKLQQNKAIYNITKDSLATLLSKTLRKAGNDKHFYVWVNDYKNIHKKDYQQDKQIKINHNGGFISLQILENNIGYIKWVRSLADDAAFKKIKNAFHFLEGVSHLIIDISENPGGDGRSNGFIAQHFFKTNAYQTLLQKRCTSNYKWANSEVPYNFSDAPKFHNTPLYIITSKNTGSAAEYFALIFKEMKRATLLGQTTAGAGNPIVQLTFKELSMYMPICEIETTNETSIEGVGVRPHIELHSKDWLQETIEYIQNKSETKN